MAPSMASHSQSIPCKASYATRPCFHNARKTSPRPLLETTMGGTTGTDARLVQRIPLAASAEHEENGIHRLPISDAGR